MAVPCSITPRISTAHSFSLLPQSSGYLLRKHFVTPVAEPFLEIFLHEKASQASHGVAQFHGQILASGQLSMDLEWCPDGDLQTVLEARVRDSADREQAFSAKWLIGLTLQMLETMSALHTTRIAHRQIILRHWVLAGDTVKLIDFSCAKPIETSKTVAAHTFRNSRDYTSPQSMESVKLQEVAENDPFKEDIWALGKVIYELATGKAYRYLNSMPQEILAQEVHFHFQSRGYLQLERAILSMLAWNQAERCTAAQALSLLQDDLRTSEKPSLPALLPNEEATTEDPRYRCPSCHTHFHTQQGPVCAKCAKSS